MFTCAVKMGMVPANPCRAVTLAELVETYMDAYKKGTEETAVYAHFESDFVRSAYYRIRGQIDYKLESTEKSMITSIPLPFW